MATDDQQILVTGLANTPATFKIPGNGQVRPKTVFAHFNGAGAATAFKPALKVISDGGETVGIYPTDSQVAAGGSADVTWFPGLAGGFEGVPGAVLQAFLFQGTAAQFTWTGPPAVNVSSGYPVNNTFTKQVNNSYLQIIGEGDFTPGPASDMLTMGLWMNAVNRINVASATLAGDTFSSVQLGTVRGVGVDSPNFPAGAYTLDVKVGSYTGQTTTFRCKDAALFTILEIVPNPP